MISTSATFDNVMNSNYRPKCEPVIKVSGTDNNGTETTLVWQAKNITSMKYKRGIDPAGRTLPYMELTWTEIYTGKLNAQNYPEKYNNIAKYMEVELSFVQDLKGYGNSLNDTETITVPKMFLAARPTIKKNTIEWTAKDILSFLDEQQIKSFEVGISYVNPMIYFILNARGSYLKSPQLFSALTDTGKELLNFNADTLDKRIIFDDATKNILLNYACLRNAHWNFKNGIAVLKNMSIDSPVFNFSKKILYAYPTVTNNTNISSYKFKYYLAELDEDGAYEKVASPSCVIDGQQWYTWHFKKYGLLVGEGSPLEGLPDHEINYAFSWYGHALTITPVNFNGFDSDLNNNKIGETYVEDNPVNPYDSNSDYSISRLSFLDSYFNSDCSSLEFTALANPAIEAGDIISVDTNLFDGDTQITKNAIVIGLEIDYNGTLKEKITAHEVKL